MTFAIGIGTVEKGATAFDGKTQGCSVNLVAGARPAAHSPQPVADFADGESGFPKLALLHNAFCPFRRPALIGGARGAGVQPSSVRLRSTSFGGHPSPVNMSGQPPEARRAKGGGTKDAAIQPSPVHLRSASFGGHPSLFWRGWLATHSCGAAKGGGWGVRLTRPPVDSP